MPRYSETEFRLASNYSHRTKKGQKHRRNRSPPPKKMGNSTKGGCCFCNHKVITRVTSRIELNNYLADNKSTKSSEKIDLYFDSKYERFFDIKIKTKVKKYRSSYTRGYINGSGRVKFSNGDIYVGEWKNFLMDGKGTYYHYNGDKYTGEWKIGKKEGKGIYTYSNGDINKGTWINDKMDGIFTRTKYKSSVYENVWKDNVIISSSQKIRISPPDNIEKLEIEIFANLINNISVE